MGRLLPSCGQPSQKRRGYAPRRRLKQANFVLMSALLFRRISGQAFHRTNSTRCFRWIFSISWGNLPSQPRMKISFIEWLGTGGHTSTPRKQMGHN